MAGGLRVQCVHLFFIPTGPVPGGPTVTIGDHSFSDGLEKARIGPVEELRGAPKIFNGRKKKRKKKKEKEKSVITRLHHCDRLGSLQIFSKQ